MNIFNKNLKNGYLNTNFLILFFYIFWILPKTFYENSSLPTTKPYTPSLQQNQFFITNLKIATWSGKVRKNLEKWQKSGKNGGLWKKSRKCQENFLQKNQIFSIQIYKIPYIKKPSIGKKLIENPLKSD